MTNLSTTMVTSPMDNTSLSMDDSTSQSMASDLEHYGGVSMEKPLKEFRYIMLPLINTIVCIVGIIGNGLVIYIMFRKVRNRSITDTYVLNLAIADFIFVSMLPFWTLDIALDGWPFGSFWCKMASGCTYFDMYASVFFLTAMSVDRLIAVVLYQSIKRTIFRARIVISVIWLFSIIIGLIPMHFRDTTPSFNNDSLPKCDWTFEDNVTAHYTWFTTFTVTRFGIGFILPLLIILSSYSAIIYFLKTRNTSGKLTEKVQDRATRMVLVVIGVFLVCWLPNQVSNLVYVAKSYAEAQTSIAHYYVHMFTTALAWMHSCLNPILYAFTRDDLREKAKQVFCEIKDCCGCSKNKGYSSNGEDLSVSEGKTGMRVPMKEDATQLLRLTSVRNQSLENFDNYDEKRKEGQPDEIKEGLLLPHNDSSASTLSHFSMPPNNNANRDSRTENSDISSNKEQIMEVVDGIDRLEEITNYIESDKTSILS